MKKTYIISALLLLATSMAGCSEDIPQEAQHAPELISIIPKAGYPGTEAIISGYWFSSEMSCISAEIGGKPAEITSSSIDRIHVIMPDMPLGSYPVKITVNGMEAEGLSFRYAEEITREQLAIYSYSPSSGIEGDEIAINGACFSPNPARNEVTINGKPAEVKDASESRLTVMIPDNLPGSYSFSITVDGETAEGPLFTYNRKPELTVASIVPNSGTAGDEVTITGLCFSDVPDGNTVRVNGKTAEVISATDKELHVIMPENPAGSYPVSVTVGDKTAEGPLFAYVNLSLRYTVKTVSGISGRAPDATNPVDGGPSSAQWRNPRGMCFLPDGRLTVIESGQNTIRFMDLSDYSVKTSTTARSLLNAPWAVSRQGDWLYVASKGNGKVIRYNYVEDRAEELTSAFSGKSPMSVRFDAAGNAYVAVRDNKAIYRYPGGDFTMQETFAVLEDWPLAIEFDSEGNLITATNGCQLIKISPAGESTVIAGIRAAKAGDPGTPGQPLTARFGANIYGIAIDADDNIYFTDQSPNHVVWMMARGDKGYEDAVISVVAGTIGSSGAVDGTGTAARLNAPCDIIFTPAQDKMYLTESDANFRIREITLEHVRN